MNRLLENFKQASSCYNEENLILTALPQHANSLFQMADSCIRLLSMQDLGEDQLLRFCTSKEAVLLIQTLDSQVTRTYLTVGPELVVCQRFDSESDTSFVNRPLKQYWYIG